MDNTEIKDLIKKIGLRCEFNMNPIAYLKGITSTLHALGYTDRFITEFSNEFKNTYNLVKYSYDGEYLSYSEKYFRKGKREK